MIQTTAPTPGAAPKGAIAALASPTGATPPDATFAALLGGTTALATPEQTLQTDEVALVTPEVADALTVDTLKGAQDGLAALAIQAGVAAIPRHSARTDLPTGTPIMPPGATPPPVTTQTPRPLTLAPEGRPAAIASHAALAAAIALPPLRPVGDASLAMPLPMPSRETPPASVEPVVDLVGKVDAAGGKDDGNILPDGTAQPDPAETLAADLPSMAILAPSEAFDPLAALPPLGTTGPAVRQGPVQAPSPRAAAALMETVRPNITPLAAGPARPASVASPPSPEVGAVRFERIEVVRAEPRPPSGAQIPTAPTTGVSAPAVSIPPAPSDPALPSAAPEPWPAIALGPLKPRPTVNAAPAPRPAALIEPAVATVTTPVAAPPAATASDDHHPAVIPTAPRDEATEPQPAKPRDAETAAARPLPRTALHGAPMAPTLTEAEPASTFAIAPASSPPTADAPHDFDALVNRLGEAREAAAPHLVRTAFEHAEFGRVAMQVRHEDGGLAVTLASHDPEFTGAVQAAAASMAGGSAGNPDQPRQDSPTPQQGQSQNAAQSNAGGQNPQQARADASGQQPRREGGSHSSGRQDQPQSGSSQRGREQRSGGSDVYA